MKTRVQNPSRWLAAGLLSFAAMLPSIALTPADTASVLYMKQEEKMARDVYQALFVRWNHVTFRHLAAAEQRHMDAMDGLIARHGLTDTTPAEMGRFSIGELQRFHDDLLAQGNTSLADAWRVGITIEEADIADLKEAIEATREPSIQRVFGNLLRASARHLGAFNAALENGDATEFACAAAWTCPRADLEAGAEGATACGPRGRKGGQCFQTVAVAAGSAPCPGNDRCLSSRRREGCTRVGGSSPTRTEMPSGSNGR